MPNPPTPPASGSDIGTISDSSANGGPANEQSTDAAALGPREVHPDVAEPVLEPIEGPAKTAPPPSDKGQPQDVKGDQKQIAPAETAKEPWPAIDCSKPHQEVEAAITECMKTKYGAALVTDMDDAQLLLSYVTRNGLQEDRKISDEIIQTLIASRQHMRAGIFDSEKEEAGFRKSYGIIAKAAEPVTVVSLRDSLMTELYSRWYFMEPELRPIAEIACWRYRKLAIIVLTLLLIVQIYWTISSSVLNKTDELISQINKAPTKQYYLAQEAARVAALKPTSQPTTAGPAASTAVSPEATPSESKGDKPLTLDELVSKIGELNANYSMLGKFMAPFSGLYFHPENPSPANPDKDKSNPAKETPPKTPDIFTPSLFQNESASIRTVAGQVIDVMQKWLLPLLYGALGAMVFVVRTLSVQARDRLFRKEALVSLVLRVYLGMISGLAIGWFWNQNPQAASTAGPMTISTLSPFALAFVAGYGVELFFTLLDKIVSAFTNKP